MSIQTTCPACRISAEHAEQLQGQQVNCPYCGAAMIVGQALQSGPTAAPAAPFDPSWSGPPAQKSPFNLLLVLLAIFGAGGLLFCCLIGVVASIAIPSLQRPRPALNQRPQPQPPAAAPVPAPPSSFTINPYTQTIELLRKQLASTQERKAAHEERMQRLGSNVPNPYERMETSLQEQIERLEQASQQWEQQRAAKWPL